MKDLRQFYINGQWVNPVQANDLNVENPATEEMIATISLGAAADVDAAVAAAKAAFPVYSKFSVDERIALMEKLNHQILPTPMKRRLTGIKREGLHIYIYIYI